MLTISIVQPEGSGDARTPWTYPANFWATVTTEQQIAELTAIATSYLPKKEDGK